MKDSKIGKVVQTLISAQYGFSIAAALVLIAMIGYEVIARYVLRANLMGVEEVMIYPIIWLYMLGGANASCEKSHIECGILTLYIKKERSIKIFEAVKRTICIVILIWLCRWGLYYFNYSLKTWKIGDITSCPLFFANVALPLGFFFMLLYGIRDIVNAYKDLFGSKGETTEKEEEK